MSPEAVITAILALIKIVKEGSDAIARLRQLIDALPESEKTQVLAAVRERLGTEAGVRLETWDDLIAWVAPE